MVEAGTLCINADVVKKAGAFANATAIAEASTNVLIKQAEGEICAACRYDIVTNYAGLSTIAKEFFRDIASSYAAVNVIQYDMSGLDTQQAMSMVNINWAIYSMGIKRCESDLFREFLGVDS
jgi:hypothetical protein